MCKILTGFAQFANNLIIGPRKMAERLPVGHGLTPQMRPRQEGTGGVVEVHDRKKLVLPRGQAR